MWKEFKEFAMKGNVIDMAVGVVVGGAFGGVVSSLVSDIIMPLVGVLTGGVSFKDMSVTLTPAIKEGGEVVQAANTLNYGAFIDAIINFFIIAFSIFLVIRLFASAKKKLLHTEASEPETPPAPTSEELLTEIRDLLKSQETPAPAQKVDSAAGQK